MDLTLTPLSPSARLAMTSLVAARHPTESCGTNGLPLTPNSTCILGQAQAMKALPDHPNLATFLDCLRGKHERIVVVAESYADNLDNVEKHLSEERLLEVAVDLCRGLAFLHRRGHLHTCMEPDTVLLNPDGRAKLSRYWLGHVTAYGDYAAFPICNPRFAAPELIATGLPETILKPETEKAPEEGDQATADSLMHIPDAPEARHDPRCDVWSLGVILACHAIKLREPWTRLKIPQVLRKVLSFQGYQGDVLERLARENDRQEAGKAIGERLRDVIRSCLQPRVEDRPTAAELYHMLTGSAFDPCEFEPSTFPTMKLRCRDLVKEDDWALVNGNGDVADDDDDEGEDDEKALDVLSIQEAYYLWKLAGGDVWAELRKRGLMVTRPPALALPRIVLSEGHTEGMVKEVVMPHPLQSRRGRGGGRHVRCRETRFHSCVRNARPCVRPAPRSAHCPGRCSS